MASKKQSGSAIMKWDEELAKAAEAAAATEASTGGGKFISVKGGVLAYNGAPVPGNKLPVIILDSIFENVYYSKEFDADEPAGPDCFAFGREEKGMTPHQVVIDAGTAQEGPCASCPMNVFGSADKGKGKACRNTRRLGLISAGQFAANGKFTAINDPEYYAKADVAFFKLPVTSVKGYAAYVKQVAAALKRPPFGIITRLAVEPDPKTQFKVVMEPMQKVPDNLMEAIMARRKEVEASIDFPYQLNFDEKPKAAKGKGSAKAAAKKKGRY